MSKSQNHIQNFPQQSAGNKRAVDRGSESATGGRFGLPHVVLSSQPAARLLLSKTLCVNHASSWCLERFPLVLTHTAGVESHLLSLGNPVQWTPPHLSGLLVVVNNQDFRAWQDLSRGEQFCEPLGNAQQLPRSVSSE